MDLILNLAVLVALQQPPLPRVLIIGDSVSIGYTPVVRELLQGVADVRRPPVNCGSSGRGAREIDNWLGEGRWDVIHFNFGLHDATPSADPAAHVRRYTENLRSIVDRLQKTGAILIWASSTPLPAEVIIRNGKPAKFQKDVLALNSAAGEFMHQRKIAIDDLFGFALPKLKELQIENDMHFTGKGSRALASQVAASIRAALADRAAARDGPRR